MKLRHVGYTDVCNFISLVIIPYTIVFRVSLFFVLIDILPLTSLLPFYWCVHAKPIPSCWFDSFANYCWYIKYYIAMCMGEFTRKRITYHYNKHPFNVIQDPLCLSIEYLLSIMYTISYKCVCLFGKELRVSATRFKLRRF